MCFGSISVSCNSLREADFLFVFFLEREVRNSVVNKVERLLCAFFIRFPVLDKNLVKKRGYFIFEINLH